MEEYFKKGGLFDGIAGVLIRSFWLGFVLMMVWFCFALAGGEWIAGVHAAWFGIEPYEVHLIIYRGMALFKLCLLLFFLIPFVAIKMMVKK